MKKKYLYHIIAWLLFLSYDYIEYFIKEEPCFDDLAVMTTYDLIGMITFYLIYLKVSHWMFDESKLWQILVGISGGISFFILTRYLIQEKLFLVLFGFKNYVRDDFGYYVLDNLWRGFIFVIAGVMVYLVEKTINQDRENIELENAKAQAELANLRAQVNPHFLFNSLSFLYAEALETNEKLAGSILNLSGILRHTIDSTKKNKVSLEKEVQLLEDYIELFRLRFSKNCYIQFDKNISNLDQKIEPFLLLPFIENAIKHGVFSNPEEPIEIALTIDSTQLLFNCENKIKTTPKDDGSGVGIENVKKRLALIYPDKYQFYTEEKDGCFYVKLQIDL